MAAGVEGESARRVSGCVTGLLRRQPFFGSLALRLPLRADAGRATLASDGREIRFEGMETVAVLIDTSGSLPAATLAGFWAELRAVAAEVAPQRVILLQVDAAVQDAVEYAPDDLPEEIAVRGRGGTDFRPGLAWLDAQGIRPAVCLYFTDMECSRYPEAEPPFPVLWCDHGDSDSPWRHPAPWGERVAIEP